MFVTDVDGDGDNDVVTQPGGAPLRPLVVRADAKGDELSFVEHRFLDDEPVDSPYGVRFGELHALDLADVDGDGLLDIVTGKRWWSHGPKGDPEPGSKPVVYWFQLVRGPNGCRIRAAPGGRRLGRRRVPDDGDVDHDGLRDVVIGNKRGVFVLNQRRGPAVVQAEHAGTAHARLRVGRLARLDDDGRRVRRSAVKGDTIAARQREKSLHAGEIGSAATRRSATSHRHADVRAVRGRAAVGELPGRRRQVDGDARRDRAGRRAARRLPDLRPPTTSRCSASPPT
jgi:hypothetical protein